jgi:hypothetical protein
MNETQDAGASRGDHYDRRALIFGAGSAAAAGVAATLGAGAPRADVPKFTNVTLIAQRDRIVATAG